MLERDSHLRQRAARALDALRGRDHGRLAGDHCDAVLVGAIAVEHQTAGRLLAKAHGDGYGQRVAHAHGRMKGQRLARVARARSGQPRAEHRRDERRAPHAVRNHAMEAGRCGGLGVALRRGDVARHRSEELQVGRGERALDGRTVSDDDLVEGAVAQDLEVLGRESAGHDSLMQECGSRRPRSGCRR